MEKIPTVFERDWEGDRSRVLDEVVPGCEWVFAGEGKATRKFDGTCVMLDSDGRWWARREVKEGKEAPPGFKPIAHDHITLAAVGWQPIEDSPFAKFFEEAALNYSGDLVESKPLAPGTYELVGPKINKNPEGMIRHELLAHADMEYAPVNRTFAGMREFLRKRGWEGIVFHHEDGRRMAKIKSRDFGIRR